VGPRRPEDSRTKGTISIPNRIRYRLLRGGDPSVVPAFGLLLVLGRAVLVERREGVRGIASKRCMGPSRT
jgi:hypothetical protein